VLLDARERLGGRRPVRRLAEQRRRQLVRLADHALAFRLELPYGDEERRVRM
jgi:hypothetical protein